jgi:hypothetical protein
LQSSMVAAQNSSFSNVKRPPFGSGRMQTVTAFNRA